jgi:DsbC/DsbD-like thiol-disulfide interchange protein
MKTAQIPLSLAALSAAGVMLYGVASQAQGVSSSVGAVTRPAMVLPGATSGAVSSPWVKGYNSAVRLLAGAEPAGEGGRRLVVGVEFRLADGWKTYWRHPGDDGGLPPTFDWAGSGNVKSLRVLYPAPERSKSLNGTTIGYSKGVIFPVEIEAVDSRRAVEIKLDMAYGICREICVPAEAKLSVIVPSGLATMPPELAQSLRRVPLLLGEAAAGKILRSAKASLGGAAPAIVLEVVTSAAAGRAGLKDLDLFVEAPPGFDLPVPMRVADAAGDAARFRIDLKGLERPQALAGLPLRLTVKEKVGSFEFVWLVQ